MAKTTSTEHTSQSTGTTSAELKAATPIAKTGQPLAKGSKVTLECEVVDVLQGEMVEVRFDGGTFMCKAGVLTSA
jgi:flavin reductase (DIM6/NTAB) family NADH-FMN oxidoreductase RutF